ncbi:MAG: hypothetical protein ABI682_12405 [Acidobacteriota bacterium]
MTCFDDAPRLDEELSRLLAVTEADVERATKSYLRKKNRAVVLVRP